MNNQNAQETGNFSTIRFSFPESALTGVSRMCIIGNDLLIYTTNDKTQEEFTKMNFKVVEKQYKLHVSAQNEQIFKEAFNNVEILDNRSIEGRFIATIKASDLEQYKEFLTKDSTELRVKQFRPQYANTSNENKYNNYQYNNYQQHQTHQQYHNNYNNLHNYNTHKGKGKGFQNNDQKGKSKGKGKTKNYSGI